MIWRAGCLALLMLVGCSPEVATDVIVSDVTKAEHRLFPWRSLRSAEPCVMGRPLPLGYGSVTAEIIVDRSGWVRIERLFSDYGAMTPACRALARAEISRWRYRPFDYGNGPVAVRLTETLAVDPPERWREPRVPFPEAGDLSAARIVLERGHCFGRCPVYRVELRGDGRALYEGGYFVDVVGEREGRIDPREFETLVQEFREADFFSLHEAYEAPITDMSATRLTVQIGGRTHTVTDYVGESVGMPSVVVDLERRVDEVGRTAQWTGRDR